MFDDYTYLALTGVYLAPADGGQVVFVATDRFIASHETLKIEEGEAFEATIPECVVASLLAVLTPIDVEGYDEDGPVPPVEPFNLATFVLADDGKVTARLVGVETIEIAFEPPSMKFPNISKIFAEAEAGTGEPLARAHFDPGRLAAVVAAVKAREGGYPLEVVAAAAGQPMLVRQGDSFKALIMPVKVSDG
jgi:hypothetical protein